MTPTSDTLPNSAECAALVRKATCVSSGDHEGAVAWMSAPPLPRQKSVYTSAAGATFVMFLGGEPLSGITQTSSPVRWSPGCQVDRPSYWTYRVRTPASADPL